MNPPQDNLKKATKNIKQGKEFKKLEEYEQEFVLGIFETGYSLAKAETLKKVFEDELKWLETTFIDLRAVRTQVAGLSSFQIRIENKIDYLKHELERLK